MPLDLAPSLADLASDAAAGLKEHFGIDATVTAAAPGRVNLIGEHIDYCDGFVLPFAIDRYIVMAAALNGTNEARVATALGGDAPSPSRAPARTQWSANKPSSFVRFAYFGYLRASANPNPASHTAGPPSTAVSATAPAGGCNDRVSDILSCSTIVY
jgi:galactokinase